MQQSMLLPTCKHMHAELSPALKQLEQLTTLVQQQGQLLQQQGQRLLSEYCKTRSSGLDSGRWVSLPPFVAPLP
jgi:hypothetical protein